MKDSKHEVYIIVVSWNNEKILPECFDSVKDQTYKNHQTILVDNDSKDSTLSMVKKDYPWVNVMAQSSNLGFAQGNNVGMKKALDDPDCRYIVLLNSDARLAKNWIETLVNFADNHPDGACFQGLTLDYYDHDTVDSRWTLINHNGSGIQVGYREPRAEQKIQEATVFGVNAAAALYSKKFLTEQPFGEHYFDDDLFMYLEDVDLCARAIVMGWNNYFTDKALAYHMGSASSSKRPWFSTYFIYRNNALILYKNLPFKLIRRMIKGAIKTDLITLKHHIKRREYRVARAVVRGRIASLFLLPSYTKKRRMMKSVAKRDAEKIWDLM